MKLFPKESMVITSLKAQKRAMIIYQGTLVQAIAHKLILIFLNSKTEK